MLRQFINHQIRSVVGDGKAPTEFLLPPGDPGLFGPNSIAWKIHGDFVSMMIGGISSLILQALHPLALAGVWDHSSFREDLKGRLGRTARFIAVTTFGNTPMANQAMLQVRKIHEAIRGTHPDGRTYWANDPRLLYWVHLTETSSFLNAHRLYLNPEISDIAADQYYQEMSVIANGLGCMITNQLGQDVLAKSCSQAQKDLTSYFCELEYSDRAQFVIQLLENYPLQETNSPLNRLIIQAGFYNLPDWAYPIIQRPIPSQIERIFLNQSIYLLAKPIRWALNNGVAAHARRRMGIS